MLVVVYHFPRQPVGSIFARGTNRLFRNVGKQVSSLRRITSPKSEGLNYTTSDAWNLAQTSSYVTPTNKDFPQPRSWKKELTLASFLKKAFIWVETDLCPRAAQILQKCCTYLSISYAAYWTPTIIRHHVRPVLRDLYIPWYTQS